MGRITSSGCVRNDRITRDEIECDQVVSCDPVVPGAPIDVIAEVTMYLLYEGHPIKIETFFIV